MRTSSLAALAFLFNGACVSTMDHGSKTNGVVYLSHEESYLKKCEDLGSIQANPAGEWGGKIGNAQARVNALEKTRGLGGTHFMETDSNMMDGSVSGKGYKCAKP